MTSTIPSHGSVELSWSFTPLDYFEAPVTVVRNSYVMTIDHGSANVRMPIAEFDSRPDFEEVLHESLTARFLATAIFNHQPYTLGKPVIKRIDKQGNVHHVLVAEEFAITATLGQVDVIVRDAAGHITVDTKAERIKKRNAFADLIEMHRHDALLKFLAAAYESSVQDPGNELIHLFEISEALSTKYGGDKNAQKTLQIKSKDWSELGRLCNHEPFRQGRHRGENAGVLKDASPAELALARDLSFGMIEAYVNVLKAQPT